MRISKQKQASQLKAPFTQAYSESSTRSKAFWHKRPTKKSVNLSKTEKIFRFSTNFINLSKTKTKTMRVFGQKC